MSSSGSKRQPRGSSAPGKRQLADSREKRDEVMRIQKLIQARWAANSAHEVDVPGDTSKPKYFVTFPFPYMNGYFHLGHAFTMSKPDFYARYKRMKGFQVLYPFGLHCTGQPIVSGAVILSREMDEFGIPPVFPEEEGEEEEEGETETETQSETETDRRLKPKESREHQWNILIKSGLTPSEIPPFKNPSHWIDYFPSHASQQLTDLGMNVDLRRMFITTSTNPYYDAFIQWQFRLLKKMDLVRFGKRMSIVSPSDGELCPDHARRKGEHARPKEFVIIKLKIVEEDIPMSQDWDGVREAGLAGRVFLGAATLRPETMYGQTNCWLAPDGPVYGAYLMKNGDVLIVTERAARNLAYQEQLASVDSWEHSLVPKFEGKTLFGCRVRAPLCRYEFIHVLPMTTINVEKTTGVVTSVPSDSPEDFAAYRDLRTKPGLREVFGVEEDWIRFDVVNIIRTEKYGDCAAQFVVEERNIQSQKQVDLIKKAHDEVYKEGFYKGTMLVGDYRGMPVHEAKDVIRDAMIAAGDALPYYEPEELVVSRAGEVCVAAWTDQWYMSYYGQPEWKKKVMDHAQSEDFETFTGATRKLMVEGIEWLGEWGCSREFGLGSQLPFDPKYLIESLSDSTIYMAYYTIAHFLQGDIFGQTAGLMGISPEDLSDEVFEFVFRKGPMPDACPISEDNLTQMRASFEHWYPVDLRVSGKELVKNHLVMYLYTHSAIFGREYMPRGISVNGWVLYNGVKMSKSSGVFVLLRDAVKDYTADGLRIALAFSGDSLTDANFETNMANNCVLDIHTLIRWSKMALKLADEGVLRIETTPEFEFFDSVFEEEMKQCIVGASEGYESFRFMNVLNHAWYGLTAAKDRYEVRMGRATPQNMREDLVREYVRIATLLMAPIIPHTSEYLWTDVQGNESSVFDQSFPEPEEPDWEILEREKYLLHTLHQFRMKKKRANRGGRSPDHAHIIVAPEYEDWQIQAMAVFRDVVAEEGESCIARNIRSVVPRIEVAFAEQAIRQEALKFLSARRKRYFAAKLGDPTISVETFFSGTRTWDEFGFWKGENAIRFSSKELGVDVSVYSKKELSDDMRAKWARSLPECLPGFPVVIWTHSEAK